MHHDVEWFSAAFTGAPDEEESDGIHFVRKGRQWSVHWHAFWHYRRRLLGNFDAVIDQVNTIPFLTPLWSSVPCFMFIHQLAREVWWYESRFPLSAIGYAAEPVYLRMYRRIPVFTVSNSTESDLRALGFQGPITVVSEGLEPISAPTESKAEVPTFLYVGRMSPSKRVGDVIKAFVRFRQIAGDGRLWLVGDGPPSYTRGLHALVHRHEVTNEVTFWGRLPAKEKHSLMARAHVLLVASVREGWGLVVIEANACGTPAVAYNVPGLRDAVRHEQTGLLVNPSPSSLADGMMRLWSDPDFYRGVAQEAERWSHGFSFDLAAETIERVIRQRLTEQPKHVVPGAVQN